MRDLIGDLAHPFDKRLVLVEQAIELVGKQIKFIGRFVYRNSGFSVSFEDSAHGFPHTVDFGE